jgi:transposase
VSSHAAAVTDDGFRRIWIKSSVKARHDEEHRAARVAEAQAALKDLQGRLNHRNLKTQRQIKAACNAILKARQCEDFLKVTLISKVITTYKHARPGRPKAGDPKRRVSDTQYELKIDVNASRLRQERNVDGVFPLVTNLPATSSALDVLQIHRYQPYLERRFQNLKSEYSVAPVYLKTPKRIVGFLHVCFLALMVAALIERELRQQMAAAKIESLPIYPEERECRAPTTARILDLFGQVDWFRHVSGEENIEYPVQLTALQTQILKLLGTSDAIYDPSLAGQ